MVQMAKSLQIRMTFAIAIGFIAVAFGFFAFGLLPLHKDKIWAFEVQRKLNPAVTRAWATNAMKFYSRTSDFNTFKTWLTNAPAVLTNSYSRLPTVFVSEEDGEAVCLQLRYGGGMYDWGLTIGQTNLPSSYARGKKTERWSDGIYYWAN
jgi:hypothetical protein